MIIVDHIDAIGTILGGKGADTFNVFETQDGSATCPDDALQRPGR